MARPADPRKAAAWQRRLQRFATSGTTLTRFCSREGVSIAALHYWRRKLDPRQPERSPMPAAPTFQPVDLLTQRAVVIRFTAGSVMEIPGDRSDLVQAAISVLSAEAQPC
ncbi:MAG: IS66 family insertion sequence element accessory protein TnpA [Planctomycetota bacterium]